MKIGPNAHAKEDLQKNLFHEISASSLSRRRSVLGWSESSFATPAIVENIALRRDDPRALTKSAAMHQRLAREIADVMARRARPSYGTRVRGALRKILLMGKPTGKSSSE